MTRTSRHPLARRFANGMLAALLLCTAASAAATTAPETLHIRVDAQAEGTAFAHFWEQMFGSGRAALALRADYRRDMQMVRQITDFSARAVWS